MVCFHTIWLSSLPKRHMSIKFNQSPIVLVQKKAQKTGSSGQFCFKEKERNPYIEK